MDFIRVKSLRSCSYCHNALSTLQNTFSSDVDLEEFLRSLYPQFSDIDSIEMASFRDEIKGFVVNFTHFMKLPKRADEAFCHLAIDRHAGIL